MTTNGTATNDNTSTARTTAARHRWVPYVAAAAGAALLLKAVLIIGSSNAVADGPMAVLYLGGLLLAGVAAVGAGLRRERIAARVGVALAGVVLLAVWIMGLGDSLKPLIAAVSDAEHVQAEVPVALAGVALLALAWRGWSGDVTARASAEG